MTGLSGHHSLDTTEKSLAHLHISDVTLGTPAIGLGSFPEQGAFHTLDLGKGEFLAILAFWGQCGLFVLGSLFS